jgi:quercetin dioxygenase-like cupin family protein
MSYGEKEKALIKKAEAPYYQERLKEVEERKKKERGMKDIISSDEMPWEVCQQGTIKHLLNEKLDTRIKTLDIYMQCIPGGSRSGKHRHMAEEYMFILEGKGYSLHWDVDMELGEEYYWEAQETPSKWEWEQGDSVYIPPNTIHQHFNADSDNPVRFIAAESRVMKYMGLDDLEQLENAPEFEGKK